MMLLIVGLTMAAGAASAAAQPVTTLIVDVRTGDVRFGGTDDNVHLLIGGREFPLDDPGRDDFERGHTDRFTLDLSSDPLSLELIRGVGQLSIVKMEDSLFGGGWRFAGLTIWAGNPGTDPLFSNGSVNRWLDGDDLEWVTTLADPGWNVPEPPAFPPCTGTVIILFKPAGDPSLDSDCDGISDDQDPTFDPPVDSDGDGLPDLYETQTGTNPTDTDSDDDGWADGRNRRSVLVLTRIVCEDENEDIGSDELYLTVEDVRHPKSFDLEGYWAMNDGTTRSPGVILDSRVVPAGTPAAYASRMVLRESDFTWLERPTDDTFARFDLEWAGDSGTTTFTHDGDDARYVLTFRWFTLDVRDPNQGNVDGDGDGLDEAAEARMSVQDPGVQPTMIAGHNGLADPAHRELWVEVDASGGDQRLQFDAKQMVASQFAYNGIAPRFDDGWFGNRDGGLLPYREVLRPVDADQFFNDPQTFAAERRALKTAFRYALFVDDLEEGAGGFGDARCSGGCRLMIGGVFALGHTMTFQSQPIIFMHEIGHTLGMCHRSGDRDPQNPPSCPATGVRCAEFCGIGQESNTAMGSETGGDTAGPLVAGGLTGVGAGIVAGALIGSAAGPAGAVVGAIIGGIVGGAGGALVGAILGADFYAREVNYDLREWANLHVFANP